MLLQEAAVDAVVASDCEQNRRKPQCSRMALESAMAAAGGSCVYRNGRWDPRCSQAAPAGVRAAAGGSSGCRSDRGLLQEAAVGAEMAGGSSREGRRELQFQMLQWGPVDAAGEGGCSGEVADAGGSSGEVADAGGSAGEVVYPPAATEEAERRHRSRASRVRRMSRALGR